MINYTSLTPVIQSTQPQTTQSPSIYTANTETTENVSSSPPFPRLHPLFQISRAYALSHVIALDTTRASICTPAQFAPLTK